MQLLEQLTIEVSAIFFRPYLTNRNCVIINSLFVDFLYDKN